MNNYKRDISNINNKLDLNLEHCNNKDYDTELIKGIENIPVCSLAVNLIGQYSPSTNRNNSGKYGLGKPASVEQDFNLPSDKTIKELKDFLLDSLSETNSNSDISSYVPVNLFGNVSKSIESLMCIDYSDLIRINMEFYDISLNQKINSYNYNLNSVYTSLFIRMSVFNDGFRIPYYIKDKLNNIKIYAYPTGLDLNRVELKDYYLSVYDLSRDIYLLNINLQDLNTDPIESYTIQVVYRDDFYKAELSCKCLIKVPKYSLAFLYPDGNGKYYIKKIHEISPNIIPEFDSSKYGYAYVSRVKIWEMNVIPLYYLKPFIKGNDEIEAKISGTNLSNIINSYTIVDNPDINANLLGLSDTLGLKYSYNVPGTVPSKLNLNLGFPTGPENNSIYFNIAIKGDFTSNNILSGILLNSINGMPIKRFKDSHSNYSNQFILRNSNDDALTYYQFKYDAFGNNVDYKYNHVYSILNLTPKSYTGVTAGSDGCSLTKQSANNSWQLLIKPLNSKLNDYRDLIFCIEDGTATGIKILDINELSQKISDFIETGTKSIIIIHLVQEASRHDQYNINLLCGLDFLSDDIQLNISKSDIDVNIYAKILKTRWNYTGSGNSWSWTKDDKVVNLAQSSDKLLKILKESNIGYKSKITIDTPVYLDDINYYSKEGGIKNTLNTSESGIIIDENYLLLDNSKSKHSYLINVKQVLSNEDIQDNHETILTFGVNSENSKLDIPLSLQNNRIKITINYVK